MYIPPKFRIEDAVEIKDFLQKNSLGVLISLAHTRLTASHIPWHLHEDEEGNWFLQAHVAKANPQWKTIEENTEVLVIFQGAHTYISSTWYSHENAPTWNYQAVHLYGQANIMTESQLEVALTNLMQDYETNLPTPLRYEDLSEKLRKDYLKAIVGIEIKITEIQAKYKLSQNRNAFDFQNIINKLEETHDTQAHEVAAQMRKIQTL